MSMYPKNMLFTSESVTDDTVFVISDILSEKN